MPLMRLRAPAVARERDQRGHEIRGVFRVELERREVTSCSTVTDRPSTRTRAPDCRSTSRMARSAWADSTSRFSISTRPAIAPATSRHDAPDQSPSTGVVRGTIALAAGQPERRQVRGRLDADAKRLQRAERHPQVRPAGRPDDGELGVLGRQREREQKSRDVLGGHGSIHGDGSSVKRPANHQRQAPALAAARDAARAERVLDHADRPVPQGAVPVERDVAVVKRGDGGEHAKRQARLAAIVRVVPAHGASRRR